MGLISLIDNLDSATKTKLLGKEITKILRYTFAENDYDTLDNEILNEAVAIQLGSKLIKSKRELLIESIRTRDLKKLSFNDFENAIDFYKKNDERFYNDFQIENEYLFEPIEDNRSNYEIVTPIYGKCNGINGFPHDYQQRLKKKILFNLIRSLNPVILASMPTGAGKTVLAMETIVDLYRTFNVLTKKNINIIWIVNSKELAEQSLNSFNKIWKQKGDERVVAERYFSKFNKIYEGDHSKITFATFDLVVSRRSSSEVKKLLETCDLMVIDEAHGSDANTYSNVLLDYKNLNNDYKILGLTATPYRSSDSDFHSLKSLFKDYFTLTNESDEEEPSPLQYLIERDYLSSVKFEILNMSDGQVSLSEYYKTLHESIIEECNKLIDNKQNSIIFAKSKAHAVALSILLNNKGIENGLIVGETPDPKRKEYLKAFGDKENSLSVLVNHQILSTGIDVPGMNSIMILSDIGSPTLALQILGRAMRGTKNGGNKQNTIFLTPSNQRVLKNYKILESIVLNK